MQKNPIPTRRLSPQFEQQLKEQLNPRRRTTVIPKRSWMQRNPFLFQVTFIATALLALFSKPLYDAFIADPLPPKSGGIVPGHKR